MQKKNCFSYTYTYEYMKMKALRFMIKYLPCLPVNFQAKI